MALEIKSERSFWHLVAALFGLLTVITYFPALFGKVPFPRDMVLQFPAWSGLARSEAWQPYADIGDLVTSFYPARAFAAQAVREGTLPLWNPYFLGGAPFLASPQSSLFYPPNLLYYLFSVPTAWTLCIMLRMFLSGVFMTLFTRSIGGSRTGSVFSGIVFSLCGFMTAWQGQPMADGATWLPFVCYAVVRLEKDLSNFAVALTAFGFAMPVLAGHPEAAAHVTLVGVVLALVTWISSNRDRRFVLRFAAAGVLAMGIASIQMIPTLEWLRQMASPLDLTWPVLPLHQAFGWISRDIVRGPNSAGVWVPEAAAYVGMITFLVVPLGLFQRERRHVMFLALTTLTAAAIVYGIQPLHWLVSQIPVLSALKNGRMIFIAGFGLAALAGFGITTLERDIPFQMRRRVIAIALLGVVLSLTLIAIYKLQLATQFRVEFTRRPSFSRGLLLAGLILIVLRLYGVLRERFFAVTVCALVAFDLLTFAYGYTGFALREEIFPRAPVFDFVAKNDAARRFRVASVGTSYSANANIVYRIPSVDGYEVRLTPQPRLFSWDYTENRLDGIYLLASRLLTLKDRRPDMLNVKYLIAPARSPERELLDSSPRFHLVYNNGYIAVFENQSVLPRAFIAPANGVEVVKEPEEELNRLRSPQFDPLKSVIVTEPLPSPKKTTPLASRNFALSNAVEVLNSGINFVTVRAAVPEPAILVLSQTYYPGWKATVDGNPTPVFPADIALTGISIPAGTHEVNFIFRPTSFKIGAALTLISATFLVIVFLQPR